MCTRGLPDIYILSPRACGPRASGVYIRQTTRAHGITIKYIPSTKDSTCDEYCVPFWISRNTA